MEFQKANSFIKDKRGEIITNFAFIEHLIKKFIAIHYLKVADHPIFSEIFEDEYFNFGLLFRIFEKIIKKENIEFPINQLRRLGQLRNIVAHSTLHFDTNNENTFFRHAGESKNTEKIFEEYDSLKSNIQTKLFEILEKKGEIYKKLDY